MLKIFLVIISLQITQIITKDTTRLVFELFRHGARNPLGEMKPFKIVSTRETYKDLTTTGMRNHYMLGSLIRQKFPDIIPKSFRDLSIKVSATRRTVASALSQLTSLTSDFNQVEVENQANKDLWTPPNSTVSGDASKKSALPEKLNVFPLDIEGKDTNFMFWADDCKKVGPDYDALKKEYKDKLKDQLNASYKVYEKYGYDPKVLFEDKVWTVSNIYSLTDTLIAKIFNDKDFVFAYELLLHADIIHSFHEFSNGQDEDINKVFNTQMYDSWLDKISDMESELKGKDVKADKLGLYSAHDTNISIAAASLFGMENSFPCLLDQYQKRVVNANVPGKDEYLAIMAEIKKAGCFSTLQFASNVIIEIYTPEKSDNVNQALINNSALNVSSSLPELRVRGFYNNEQRQMDGKDDLSLTEFKKYLNKRKSSNFTKDCGSDILQDKNPQKELKIFALICLLVNVALIVMLIVIIIILKCSKSAPKQDNDEYVKVETE